MSVLHVACAARRDYVPHSAAMLHSVLTQRGEGGVHVHYLHGPDLPPRTTGLLAEMVDRSGGTISFLPIPDERVAGLRTVDFRGGDEFPVLPASHWYRIFLPELLPDVDKLLYLDADTIVVDSIEPLWATDLTDHYVAAVTNVFQADHLHHPKTLGLEPRVYFNTGVLLMNLELMRRDGCTGALRDYALTHRDQLAFPEQDAMNVVVGARRLPLHPRWNCMNSILLFPWSSDVFGPEAVAEAGRNPAIRHFEGPSINKPWHYLCEREMRELYSDHRRHTPWPEPELEGVTPRNVGKRLARDLRRGASPRSVLRQLVRDVGRRAGRSDARRHDAVSA